MKYLILLALLYSVPNTPAQKYSRSGEADRARRGGPAVQDLKREQALSPHMLLSNMFDAMEKIWVPNVYGEHKSVEFRLREDADLPARAVSRRVPTADTGEQIDFNLDLEGVAAPNGRYRMELEGGLGEVEMVHDLRRSLVASQTFRAFSDTPKRGRSDNAGLRNYRSYLLRHLNAMKNQVLNSGNYRSVYAGTGMHMGKEVHVIRLYKPLSKARKPLGKKPIPLRKMWTFWHEGGYEIWLHHGSFLPAVVFYTNVDDNVFANFSIDYTREWLPFRIDFTNNSVNAEGRGDIVLDFASDRTLRGFSLRFDGNHGVSLRADATLDFEGAPASDAFRILPPFGFRKMNRDHLKLMIMTEISGGLLKLKKHGINFKNFKF